MNEAYRHVDRSGDISLSEGPFSLKVSYALIADCKVRTTYYLKLRSDRNGNN